MARIFTTRFTFNHEIYDAIVTVISANETLEFNIKVLDAGLHDLIPGGHIRYQGEEGFEQVAVENELARSLMRSIAHSIDDHLVGK